MSCETYYDYKLIEEERKRLQEEIEKEKKRIWEEKLRLYDKIIKFEKREIKLYSEAKDEVSVKPVISEWKNETNIKKQVSDGGLNNSKIASNIKKVEKIDYSYLVVKDTKNYTLDDLLTFPVRNKAELLKKRKLLVVLENCSNADEINCEIEKFISSSSKLEKNEISVISEYNHIMTEMDKYNQEKCYDEIKEEIDRVRIKYSMWVEKKYINESLARILKEEGIIFNEDNISDGCKYKQYKIDENSDVALQLFELGSKSFLAEFVGIKSEGSTPSEEMQRKVVEKAKDTCKTMNKVCRRLYEECGIETEIKGIKEPDIESIKYIDGKICEKNKMKNSVERRIVNE